MTGIISTEKNTQEVSNRSTGQINHKTDYTDKDRGSTRITMMVFVLDITGSGRLCVSWLSIPQICSQLLIDHPNSISHFIHPMTSLTQTTTYNLKSSHPIDLMLANTFHPKTSPTQTTEIQYLSPRRMDNPKPRLSKRNPTFPTTYFIF